MLQRYVVLVALSLLCLMFNVGYTAVTLALASVWNPERCVGACDRYAFNSWEITEKSE